MGKLLLWVIIILAVMMIARIVSSRAASRRESSGAGTPARRPGEEPVESMVRCAHCGIHLPRSEAVLLDGKTWCSSDHARLGQR